MPDDESKLAKAAEIQVTKLTHAAAWFRYCLILLAVVTAGLIALSVLFGIQAQQARDLAGKIQSGSIMSCQAGNATRAADTQIWDKFVSLLLDTSSNASKSQWDAFKAYVDDNYPDQAPAWDKFLGDYLTVTPSTKNEAKEFEQFVAQTDAAHNCLKIYGK